MVVRRLAALASTLLIALTATSPTTRAQAGGSVSLTALDAPYNQDFNTLALSGTSSTLPARWELAETGTNANL